MQGIRNKQEVNKRVNYILEVLGIYKYRNRLAYMLSGGERQRVGIARAIVKNPNIIIADEPTGNLDSKNSLEIMNIIKSISKDKLVILVTHEKELAKFYATRIIKVVDGKVVEDNKNDHNNELDYRLYSKIYLKDIKSHNKINQSNLNIDYYQDEETSKKMNFKIVVKNGNVYIQSDAKIEIVDENSSIELIDDNYKKISKDTYEKYKFDYENIINKKYKPRYASIFNWFTLLIKGFQKVFNYSILKKILLLGFFVSSMFVLYAVSNIFGVLNITDDKFVSTNQNYLTIISNKNDVNEYLKYENLESINYIIPGNSKVNFNIKYEDYYQTNKQQDQLTASLASLELIAKEDIIYGKMPENNYEIVIDKIILETLIKKSVAKQVGLKGPQDFINRKIQVGVPTYGNSTNVKTLDGFTIVGITDLKSQSIYANKDMFINILANNTSNNFFENSAQKDQKEIIDINLVKDKIELKKGRLPQNDYEIIVNTNNSSQMKLNKTIDTKINGEKLKVVGYYYSKYGEDAYYSNLNTVKYKIIENSQNITVYPKDKYATIDYFRQNNINIEDTYQKDRQTYIEKIKETIIASITVAGVIMAISLVEILLMLRSSFLSRIKEVGILRAIGVKRKDIYKMFLGEILAINILVGIPGILFMSYIIKNLMSITYFNGQFMLNTNIILLSTAIVFVFNIVVGLLPVFNTLRKTPASILSSNNVD